MNAETALSVPSLILDLVALVIILLCAAVYHKKGFVSGIIDFFGTLLSLVGAGLAATGLSPVLFDKLFRTVLEQKSTAILASQPALNLQGLLSDLFGFLPEEVVTALVGTHGDKLGAAAAGLAPAQLAAEVVDKVIGPVLIPLISLNLFLLCFIVLRLLVVLISKMLTSLNLIPLVGSLNQALGLLIGAAIGLLYVFLILCALWAYDAFQANESFVSLYLSSSIANRLLSGLNFW